MTQNVTFFFSTYTVFFHIEYMCDSAYKSTDILPSLYQIFYVWLWYWKHVLGIFIFKCYAQDQDYMILKLDYLVSSSSVCMSSEYMMNWLLKNKIIPK